MEAKERFKVYDVVDCNPNNNWKARAARTRVYASTTGAEHIGHEGFKV
jgi:hypothetical protein